MQTLYDVVERARRIGDVETALGWPPGCHPRVKLPIDQQTALILPWKQEGLEGWQPGEEPAYSDEHTNQLARGALLMSPGLVIPLDGPSPTQLLAWGIDTAKWRRERARTVLLAIQTKDSEDYARLGAAEATIIENALGMDSSLVVAWEEKWFDELDELSDFLALRLSSAQNLPAKPDATGRLWRSVSLLLSNEHRELHFPAGWQHHLQLEAGLYRVTLTINANVSAATARALAELRNAPPEAVLISDRSVVEADLFMAAYDAARPEGYSTRLGTSVARSFDEVVVELGMHLREFSPIGRDDVDTSADMDEPSSISWEAAKVQILALVGGHFVLTERAKKMLDNNPYPWPRRMLNHVEGLANLAARYHEGKGKLGDSLVQVAKVSHSIEIALFDSKMPKSTVVHGGNSIEVRPHVKVDDVTSPDKCGRIYFAIDDESHCFVVDHIGLHDYY